jgi:putative hydrolase
VEIYRSNYVVAVGQVRHLDSRRALTGRRAAVSSKATRTASQPMLSSGTRALENAEIAEFLARESEQASETLKRAFKRAARAAFLWPTEASEMFKKGQPLTDLPGIGPYLERHLKNWILFPPIAVEPPAIRRHFITMAQARKLLGQRSDWLQSYRGDLQMHSNWSDGSATISEMAEAGQLRGYGYIAITDHAQGLKIAGGMSPAELRQQGEEIEAVNRSVAAGTGSFRVLKSIELNLNPAGEGDMPATALKRLDLVVGSFHSKLRTEDDQTSRYLCALRNPDVTILGHPVGRIYNHRVGLTADWTRVCAVAAQLDKALEIDAYPDRQDLNVELLRIGKAEGTRIAIDTDAHAPEQLGFIELGLAAALMADIRPDRIINFMSAEKLTAWAKSLRG